MHIRKMTALLLLAAMLLGLAGCSFPGSGTVDASEKEELMRILDELSENLHLGTAGSSLTSARLAAELIVWASTTTMDKKEAASIVAEWLQKQSPEIQKAFQEQIASVSESYGKIIKDGAADLLEAAGVEEDLSNLGSRLKELVEAVLDSGGLD